MLLRSRFHREELRRRAVHAAQALSLAAALCLALAAPTPALASPAGVALPLAGAQLAGEGELRWWGLPLYRARLWAQPGFEPAAFHRHAFALELHYLRGFRSADIARRSLQEMQRAGAIDGEQARRWEDALARLLPDVREGDRIAGIHRPDRGAAFVVNGRLAGEIADADFARRFFAIWLGPATSEPQLRAALLGQSAR